MERSPVNLVKVEEAVQMSDDQQYHSVYPLLRRKKTPMIMPNLLLIEHDPTISQSQTLLPPSRSLKRKPCPIELQKTIKSHTRENSWISTSLNNLSKIKTSKNYFSKHSSSNRLLTMKESVHNDDAHNCNHREKCYSMYVRKKAFYNMSNLPKHLKAKSIEHIKHLNISPTDNLRAKTSSQLTFTLQIKEMLLHINNKDIARQKTNKVIIPNKEIIELAKKYQIEFRRIYKIIRHYYNLVYNQSIIDQDKAMNCINYKKINEVQLHNEFLRLLVDHPFLFKLSYALGISVSAVVSPSPQRYYPFDSFIKLYKLFNGILMYNEKTNFILRFLFVDNSNILYPDFTNCISTLIKSDTIYASFLRKLHPQYDDNSHLSINAVRSALMSNPGFTSEFFTSIIKVGGNSL